MKEMFFGGYYFFCFKMNIATSTGETEHIRYVEKTVREKSVFGALLSK